MGLGAEIRAIAANGCVSLPSHLGAGETFGGEHLQRGYLHVYGRLLDETPKNRTFVKG